MPDYEGIADEIRFEDTDFVGNDDIWWKEDGRKKLAQAIQELVEVYLLSEEQAKQILKNVFWVGAAEFSGQVIDLTIRR